MKYLVGMITLIISATSSSAQELNTIIMKQRVAELLCLKTAERPQA